MGGMRAPNKWQLKSTVAPLLPRAACGFVALPSRHFIQQDPVGFGV